MVGTNRAVCQAQHVPGQFVPGRADSRPVTSERQYVDGLLQRTKEARNRVGASQAEMARMLRIGHSAYKRYEDRTPLPHHLIEAFCGITQTDIHYFVTGRHRPVLVVNRPAPEPSHLHSVKRVRNRA